MTNEKKYSSSFTKTFGISDKKLPKLKYQDIRPIIRRILLPSHGHDICINICKIQ